MKQENKLSINLRIDGKLKKALQKEADDDYRTLTSQITKVLTQWYEANKKGIIDE